MTEFNEIINNVKKTTNDFDFTNTIGEFVINNEFKQGLIELKSGYNNKNTYIWEVLSAMNTDISETIYENVLHYIDNISNVDTCKIIALKSLLEQIGIQYNIFDFCSHVPVQLLNLIDIFSINKRYLSKNNYLKNTLKKELEPLLSNNDDLDNYIETLYYNFLKDILSLKYSETETTESSSNYVINNLIDQILNSETINQSEFLLYKIQHNIDKLFDEKKIVDQIENGNDKLSNYNGCELELLKKELNRRTTPLSIKKPTTKYYYYKEKTILEYINFIKNNFLDNEWLKNYKSKYDLNHNYILLDSSDITQILTKTENGEYELNETLIKYVAEILTKITKDIRKIREKIKIEVQKNYMKGTYNLLKFVINEYLIELSNSKIFDTDSVSILNNIKNQLKIQQLENINIIEYFDTIEYFNIDTGSLSNVTNERYWEEDTIENIESDYAFTKEDINNFYQNTLECKDKITNTESFLNTLYEFGASKKTANGETISYQTKDQHKSEYELFMSYSGKDFAYYPYFNYKNSIHPSFQIHPYLNKFVAYMGYEHSIQNAFNNDINQKLEDENIANIIGKYGEIINVALNNEFDFSGYKTRYEMSPHTINGKKCNIVDYEGSFYPQAVIDFLTNKDEFIKSIKDREISKIKETFYEKYYAHLNLTDEELKYTVNQLSYYYVDIERICRENQSTQDKYDIFNYTLDNYQNIYILFKKYNQENPSTSEKQNTLGELWIRKKNHPIAFPAFYGQYPQIHEKTINGNIILLAEKSISGEHDLINDSNRMSYFYDFEMDDTKKTMLLISYPINNDIDHNCDEIKEHEDYYKKFEFGEVIICNIKQSYDNNQDINIIEMLSDKVQHKTFLNTHQLKPADKIEWDENNNKNVKCLVGFYNTINQINVLFVEKKLKKNNDKITEDISFTNTLTFSIYEYNYEHKLKEYENVTLDLSEIFKNKYKLHNTDLKFTYCDGVYSFGFLTVQKNTNFNYKTYLGLVENNYQASNLNLTCEDDKTNSFDHLEQYILILDVLFDGTLFMIDSSKFYNINADASYFPQFSGKNGFQQFFKNEYTKNINFTSIQLLGQSNNLLRDIKYELAKKQIFSLSNMEKINEFICGRIYESLSGEFYDKEKHTYGSFILKKMPWKGSSQGSDVNYWEVYLPELDINKLSSDFIVIGNRYTNSKNLYYVGKLEYFENKTVSFKDDLSSYNIRNQNSEVYDISNTNISFNGTYDLFDESANCLDSNQMYGVTDIKVSFDKQSKRLRFTFIVNGQWLIKENEFYIAIFNPNELRMYQWYHLFEPVNIDQNSLDYIDLTKYDSISSISALSGYDSLAFKYSEQDIFEPGDIRYYYPGYNTKYPIRQCDLLDIMKDDINVINQYLKYTNQTDTYIIQLNSLDDLKQLKQVVIPYQIIDNQTIIGYEDYLSSDDNFNNIYNYDKSSVKMLQYSIITENSESVIVELSNYLQKTSASSYLSIEIDNIKNNYGVEPIFVEQEHNISYENNYIYNINLSNIHEIDKFNKIFIQYDKTQDGIVLYFNFVNYYNSPFIKFENGEQVTDIIDGTFLKLEPNQEGILDIVIQIRRHLDDRNIIGVSNLKIASYKIFNLSDDKPKFMVQKISDRVYSLYDNMNEKLLSKINIENKKIILNNNTIDENLKFSIHCDTLSQCPISKYEYKLSYDSVLLKLITQDDNIKDNGLGILSINTNKNINIEFETNISISEIMKDNNSHKFAFAVVDYDIYTPENQTVECEIYNGVVECKYNNYLRKESDNSNDLILLENGNEISILGDKQ